MNFKKVTVCFFFLFFSTQFLISCKKESITNNYYFTLTIGNKTYNGEGLLGLGSIEDSNYFELVRNRIIFFSNESPFNYGGTLNLNCLDSSSEGYAISSLNWDGGFAIMPYTIPVINITRNDKVINGIFEGKINGTLTNDGTQRLNFSCNFRLKIKTE